MVKNHGKTESKLDDEVDGLFKLPLAEFIAARKEVATQLKKSGRTEEADHVKSLAKPSISAWAVNQLYWNHRVEFDQLMAAGQRFRKAQTSRQTSKLGDMREALDARREALAELSDLASTVLRDAGHNPALDTIRRVTATLEAVSAYEVLPDGATVGRLTQDVDPPGFESMGAFTPSARMPKSAERAVTPSNKTATYQKAQVKPKSSVDEVETARQAELAAAKVAVQEAKKALTAAQAKVQSLAAQQKKIETTAKDAEKVRREAEARFQKASATAEQAARRVHAINVEMEEAMGVLQNAERNVAEASKELEKSFRGSS